MKRNIRGDKTFLSGNQINYKEQERSVSQWGESNDGKTEE